MAFCTHCGEKLTNQTVVRIGGNTVCSSCGCAVNWQEEPQPVRSAQPQPHCSHCGVLLDKSTIVCVGDIAVCGNCGCAVQSENLPPSFQPKEETKTCPYCGVQLNANAQICFNCKRMYTQIPVEASGIHVAPTVWQEIVAFIKRRKALLFAAVAAIAVVLAWLLWPSDEYKQAPADGHFQSFQAASTDYLEWFTECCEEEESSVDFSYTLEWRDEWTGDKAPDESYAFSGGQPVTCVWEITAEGYFDRTEYVRVFFYMIYDETGDSLHPYAVTIDENGDVWAYGERSARDMVRAVYEKEEFID